MTMVLIIGQTCVSLAPSNGVEVDVAKEEMCGKAPNRRGQFRIGGLEGLISGPVPDFLAPMDEDELALWEGGHNEPNPHLNPEKHK